MGEQGHDDHHSLCRGTQPIEDRAFGGAEGLLALVTNASLFLLPMDTDISSFREV
jgi:hypothetical protein